jgi:hypothetical protein
MDKEVVVDNNLVSNRKPDDIPAFNREMIKLFAQAQTTAQSTRFQSYRKGVGLSGNVISNQRAKWPSTWPIQKTRVCQ